MRRVSSLVAGMVAFWGISAAPAAATTTFVRFEVQEISTLTASGIFPLIVADIDGFLHFEFVDADEDGTFETGTLVDMRLKAFGPILDDGTVTVGGVPGDGLTLTLLPGQVELLQIPDGTEFDYIDPFTPGNPVVAGTATNPAGTLVPSLETVGASHFTFDPGARLAIEGAPNTGLADCEGSLCGVALLALGGLPLLLDGPQAPLVLDDKDQDDNNLVSFEIVGLDTIETTPASLTGPFSFFLGAFPLEFDILTAPGVVVPEPDVGVGIVASLATLMLLGRRRRA